MYRDRNIIVVRDLNNPFDVGVFLRIVYRIAQLEGYDDIYLDMSETDKAFPNACVPIAAIIHYYRTKGVDIHIQNLPPLLRIMHFDDPPHPDKKTLEESPDTLSRIWRFRSPQEVSALTGSYVDALAERIECSSGVLEAFEWCINEVMDNVLQHSGNSEGLIMVQIHPDKHRAAICLSDNGTGIWGTLLHSQYKPRNAVDAITLALKEGVTRDSQEYQGNGLWGLLEIVRENAGMLTIKSGDGSVSYKGGEVRPFSGLPFLDKDHQGTTVDFQIDTSNFIDVPKALGGHRPVNLRLEQLEEPDNTHHIMVKDHSHGTGTRKAAIQLRNYVVNTINEGASRINLDFQGIGVISSSFADELIGKLVVRYGFYNFQQVMTLKNMTETVQVILHRAVAQRMMEGLRNKTPEE